jgi:peroxiredoxin-like protein
MEELPHTYRITLQGGAIGSAEVAAPGLPLLSLAPPATFGGPGDKWSPEELLLSAVASCFLFTLRAVTTASRVAFTSVECEANGILDRIEGGLAFRDILLKARINAPADTNRDRLERLVKKAEQNCLITRSLKTQIRIEAEIATPA